MKCVKCGYDLSHWDDELEEKKVSPDDLYCEDCTDEAGLPPDEGVGEFIENYNDSEHLGCKSYPFCADFGCCRD